MNIPPILSSRSKEILLIFLLFLISFTINFYNWDSLSPFEGRWEINLLKSFSFKNFEMAGGYKGVSIFNLFSTKILGFNLFSLRLPAAISIASIVVLIYLFTKDYLDRRIAILVSIMLITTPVFIFISMSDAPYLAFFSSLISFLFYRYYITRNTRYLYICAFISGHSLYFKLINMYFLISSFISFILVKWIFKLKIDFNLNKKSILLMVLLFIVGLSPVIIYNIKHGFPLISTTNEQLISEYDTLTIINRIKRRIILFIRPYPDLGSPISEDVVFLDTHNPIIFLPRFYHFNLFLFFISSILFIISRDPKKTFLLLLVFFFSFLTIFSPTTLNIAHYLPVQPFFFLIMASGLVMIYESDVRSFKIKNINKILFFILIGLYIFLNLSYVVMSLILTKDQLFIEETLPTKAIVHHKMIESLEDGDVIVYPSILFGDYIFNFYPEKEKIEFCSVFYDKNNDTCSFVSCRIEDSLFVKNKIVKYVLPYLPENPTSYNLTGYGIKEGYSCSPPFCDKYLACWFTYRPYNRYNNTNYPMEYLLGEAGKRNITLRLEKDFINAHGDVVYKVYSLEN